MHWPRHFARRLKHDNRLNYRMRWTRRTHYHAFLGHVKVKSVLFPHERLLRITRSARVHSACRVRVTARTAGKRNTGFRSAHFNYNPVNIPCWIKDLRPVVKKCTPTKNDLWFPILFLAEKKVSASGAEMINSILLNFNTQTLLLKWCNTNNQSII